MNRTVSLFMSRMTARRIFRHFPLTWLLSLTSVRRILTKGRIADLSLSRLRMDSSDVDHPFYTRFFGPARVSPQNGISIGSAILHSSLVCLLATSSSGEWFVRPWPHLMGYMVTWLGTTRVSPPNGISIGSVVFTGLRNMTNGQTDTYRQTDRPTDHATRSIAIARILCNACNGV